MPPSATRRRVLAPAGRRAPRAPAAHLQYQQNPETPRPCPSATGNGRTNLSPATPCCSPTGDHGRRPPAPSSEPPSVIKRAQRWRKEHTTTTPEPLPQLSPLPLPFPPWHRNHRHQRRRIAGEPGFPERPGVARQHRLVPLFLTVQAELAGMT